MADLKKQTCKYGINCYRKNQSHILKYEHPKITPPPTPTKRDKDIEKLNSSPNRETRNSIKNSRSSSSSSPSNSRDNYNDELNQNNKRPRIRSLSPRNLLNNNKDDYNLRSKNSGLQNSSNEDLNKTLNSSSSSSTSSFSTKQTSIYQTPKSSNTSLELNSDGPSQDNDIDFINNVYDKETRFSQRAEYKEMLSKPEIFIKHKFLVEMPSDFYIFWDYCKSIVKQNQKPEYVFEKFGLILIGPFDVLTGKFNDARMFEPGDYLRHWRFFYDPPEFQTFLKKDNSGIHYGFWRDSPKDTDCFIARNDIDKGCEINFIADNIFSAVMYFLDKDAALTPFNRLDLPALKKSMNEWMQKHNINHSSFSQNLKERNRNVVCKTFHRAGIIVPYDRKTQIGYRELMETETNLKRIIEIFQNAKGDSNAISNIMDKLLPSITAANIALDEGDFGSSLELGIDFFCSGATELHVTLLQLLVNGYSLVDKPQFIAIIKAHLAHRQLGQNLSIL